MNLSKKEEAILRALLAMQGAQQHTATVDEIALLIFKKRSGLDRPTHWRKALIVTIGTFSGKLERSGLAQIKRASLLGRGSIATYEFRGNFQKVLDRANIKRSEDRRSDQSS